MRNKEGLLISFFKKNRKGQVTIFIIIAIIIIAAIATFFILRSGLITTQIPTDLEPVYTTFLSCIQDKALTGIQVLESQGGYIELPSFEAGSTYMPFSSQLNFFGNPIPYWYYVSGNNIPKEQVPSQLDMQQSLAKFIDDKINECNFDNYYQQGFEITQGTPQATVSITNNNVEIKLNMNLQITNGKDTAFLTNYDVNVKSNLGALYNAAITVYNKEQKEFFLENYGIDTLRSYAPVDGIALSCSPETWNADEVFNNLSDEIETNTLALRTQTPSTTEEKYFYINTGVNEGVRFINSKNWTHVFNVDPSQENMLIANPVGNQPGLGILGFCYVPYHFVYDLKYPILVQVYSGDEIFQFPFAVVIQGNEPRVPLNSSASQVVSNLCPYKNTPTTVSTYDTNQNPVNSDISYECFGETCDIGQTSSGTLTANFPQCVNGYIVATANGYDQSRFLYSTVAEGNAQIVMNKLYNLNLALTLNGAAYTGTAFIYFTSNENSQVISYPQQRQINLSEGQYQIQVYIYQNSAIQLQASTKQECTTVPSSGIGGLFGVTEQNCFNINIPSQLISNVLVGGGQQNFSVNEDDLKNAHSITIDAKSFTIPKTIVDFQDNYAAVTATGLNINLK